MYLSMCVYGSKQIDRREDEYSCYLHARVFNNILQRTHVLQELFFGKIRSLPFVLRSSTPHTSI